MVCEGVVIVIASHKNEAKELVESIEKHTPNEKFIVVDSDGFGGYCINSYLRGYLENPDQEYIFLHDSMLVKDKEWLQRFRDKCKGGIVAHSTFPLRYDNPEQQNFAGFVPDGEVGVFGPIFYATAKAMEKIAPYIRDHTPVDVMQLRGWERALGNVCKHENIDIQSMYGEFNYEDVLNDRLEGLTKLFLLRS